MKTRRWAPLAVALGVALLLVAGATYSATMLQGDDEVDVVIAPRSADGAEQDSDSDGLPDWQEELYGTNVNSADTDGDGVGDQEELAMKANPTEYGSTPTEPLANYRAPAGLSPTEAMARELFAEYNSKKVDGTYSARDQQQTVENLIERHVEPIRASKIYGVSDIKLKSGTTDDTYAGALITTLRESEKVEVYELVHFAHAVGAKDFNGTPELVADAALYRSIVIQLGTIEVPPHVATEHIALMQAISNLADATQYLGTWTGDPLMALSYVDYFTATEKKMNTVFQNLLSELDV
ncbi:MAG: hypothetical protein AAB573_02350 [Patescibacteria group bacterium]